MEGLENGLFDIVDGLSHRATDTDSHRGNCENKQMWKKNECRSSQGYMCILCCWMLKPRFSTLFGGSKEGWLVGEAEEKSEMKANS